MSGLILPYRGKRPVIAADAFVAPTATVIGDTVIGAETGVWFGCVLRGDSNYIRVGARTNIQDGTVVHVDSTSYPAVIGDDVTIGHMALIHACTLEDRSFVGMYATVMDGAVVETGGMVAAGSLVTPGKRVRTGELWAGSPAKKWRDLTDAERATLTDAAAHYVELARDYLRDPEIASDTSGRR